MTNNSYTWEKFDENRSRKDTLKWQSPLLFSQKREGLLKRLISGDKKLPLLEKREDTADHNFDLEIFPEQPYDRPFTEEPVSQKTEGETIIKVARKIFTHPYSGNVDSSLSLRYLGGWDSEGRGSVYLIGGEVVAGFGPGRVPTTNAKEYLEALNRYLPNFRFGDNLFDLFRNSNLPREVVERFKCLEVK